MNDCCKPDCPCCRHIDELLSELAAVYRLLEARREDLARCPAHPKGERCCLPVEHEGECRWANGD